MIYRRLQWLVVCLCVIILLTSCSQEKYELKVVVRSNHEGEIYAPGVLIELFPLAENYYELDTQARALEISDASEKHPIVKTTNNEGIAAFKLSKGIYLLRLDYEMEVINLSSSKTIAKGVGE